MERRVRKQPVHLYSLGCANVEPGIHYCQETSHDARQPLNLVKDFPKEADAMDELMSRK
jgi:hypothetical protein